jgi:DnaJ-class molecular chaperone
MQDPYRVLNVPRQAGQAAIKAAYRELAKRLHPDRNPGDARAEQRFKQVTQAYELLRDPAKRAQFDRGLIDADGKPQFGFGQFGFGRGAGGHAGARAGADAGFRGAEGLFEKIFGGAFGRSGATGGPTFEDLRGAAPGGGRRAAGADRRYRVEVDFLLAARGGKQRLDLGGRMLEVDIPPGTEDGRVLRLKGQGGKGRPGEAGDALVTVAVRPHRHFAMQGKDVHLELPISLSEAIQGAKVTVPTIDGPVRISVPPGSNSGRSLRLKGRGVAAPGEARGDQYVRLVVMLPDRPDAELAEYVRRWAAQHPYDPRADLEDA